MPWVLLILLFAVFGNAADGSEITLGFRAGASFSSANFKPRYPYDVLAKVGPYVGIAAEFPVGKTTNSSLRIELAYIQKGWRERVYYPLYYETSTIVIKEYALTPIVVYAFPGNAVTPSIQIGLEIAHDAEATGYIKRQGDITRTNLDLWNDYNVSGILGGGLELGGRLRGATIDGRFSFGITNMYGGPGDFEATTIAFYLTTGYFFNL